jgi:dTDP-4-dehydrorhamnose 3,5-epimerase
VFKFKKTNIHDCYEIYPNVFKDNRGKFVKIFNDTCFKKKKLNLTFVETYYSISKPNVIRGLHFQSPPHDHAKLIYCIKGQITDVILDLRLGSPTYGKYFSIKLEEKKANMLYIGKGLAHGFATHNKTSILVYNLTSEHVPTHDKGILWNSIGIKWPNLKPIISKRDKSFPKLKDFISPFKYNI